MQKRFNDHLETLGCRDKKILVAVSGGLDSTVLLHLLSHSGAQVGVAHANFQLRGNDSEEDEKFVSQMTAETRKPFYSRRFETNNYAIEHGISIQMAARDLRYQWFEEIRKQHDFEYIATGHHLNDSLETALFNFSRGSGLTGIKGTTARYAKRIRPLIIFTREEIEAYARAEGLKWREDVSNERDDYSRNFIRHQIIPKLEELNPSLVHTFGKNTARLQGAYELYQLGLSQVTKEFVFEEGGQKKISKSFLAALEHPAVALQEWLAEEGFNFDQCQEIILASDSSGKYFLSKTHQLSVDRVFFIVHRIASVISDIIIQDGTTTSIRGRQKLEISESISADISTDPQIALLDKAKLQFPLLWRKWKPGDSFFPLGMKHPKKLSDFLIDNKISLADKENVTVLESAGEIAWVVGYRIDDRFKLTPQTKKILSLRTGRSV